MVRQAMRDHHSLAQLDDEFAAGAKTRPSVAVIVRCSYPTITLTPAQIKDIPTIPPAQISAFKARLLHKPEHHILFSG
jgi:hypothetical protein